MREPRSLALPVHARFLSGLEASWKGRLCHGRSSEDRRRRLAVVGGVVTHRRPLIQWRGGSSKPESTLPLSFPPLHLVLLSPRGVGRGSLTLTHTGTHTRTHTHTQAHKRLNSGRLSDKAHAGRISSSCRRSSPLWLSPFACVCI